MSTIPDRARHDHRRPARTTASAPIPVGPAAAGRIAVGLVALGLATAVVAGCGGPPSPPAPAPSAPAPASSASSPGPSPESPVPSPEANPAGDIPDDQAYVPYPAPDGLFTVSVPEGWARSTQGPATVFTDNLNAVRIETTPAAQAPTADTARTRELPALATSVPGFAPGEVRAVTRPAGPAVLITYRGTSTPDPVTARTSADDVERYEFFHAGQQVSLTLSGPAGADNVDPWRMVTDSLRWQR